MISKKPHRRRKSTFHIRGPYNSNILKLRPIITNNGNNVRILALDEQRNAPPSPISPRALLNNVEPPKHYVQLRRPPRAHGKLYRPL